MKITQQAKPSFDYLTQTLEPDYSGEVGANENFGQRAYVFTALSDRTRLKIVELLRNGAMSGSDLADQHGISLALKRSREGIFVEPERLKTERGADYLVHTERAGRQENSKESALRQIPASKGWQYMDWHIINHKDYIDGPFDSFESALAEACALGNETRPEPRVKRRSDQFFVYRAPYDREEKWRPEFWICTKDGALRLGVPEDLFDQPLREMTVGAGSMDQMRLRANGANGD